MLAKTGITKAGYLLLKRSSINSNHRRSFFIVLNDHCLSYCSERHNFELPDGNLLLTSGTRVYYQQEDDGASVIRIETGVEVLLFRGKDESEMKEWKRYVNLSQL